MCYTALSMLLYTYVCIIFTKITRRRFNDLSIKMEPCLLTIASAIFNCFPFHVNCSMLFFQLKITFSIANLFPDYETVPEKKRAVERATFNVRVLNKHNRQSSCTVLQLFLSALTWLIEGEKQIRRSWTLAEKRWSVSKLR